MKFDWKLIKDRIITYLKSEFVKAALIKLLGSAAMGGFRAWLIKVAATTLFKDIGEPIARGVLNQVGYMYDRIEGKVIIKAVKKAQEENNSGAYDDAIDDIYTH